MFEGERGDLDAALADHQETITLSRRCGPCVTGLRAVNGAIRPTPGALDGAVRPLPSSSGQAHARKRAKRLGCIQQDQFFEQKAEP
jgi:hypothetical protein